MLGSLDVMPNYVTRLKNGGATASNACVGTPKVSEIRDSKALVLHFRALPYGMFVSTLQCCPSRTSLLSGRFAHNLNDNSVGWCGDFISAARYNDTFIKQIKVCPSYKAASRLKDSVHCALNRPQGTQPCWSGKSSMTWARCVQKTTP